MSVELVSIHVPKTAGTTFFVSLRNHFGDALVTDDDHVPGTSHDLSEPPMPPPHARAVHGHFRGDRYREFKDAFHVTFLRDPVEQFISNYFFWLTYPLHGDPRHTRLVEERPDIVSFARTLKGALLHGFFSRMDPASLDFVGFTEQLDQDFAALSRLLGFPIDAGVRVNQTALPPDLEATRQDIASSLRIRSELRDVLKREYDYYDRFCAVWRSETPASAA